MVLSVENERDYSEKRKVERNSQVTRVERESVCWRGAMCVVYIWREYIIQIHLNHIFQMIFVFFGRNSNDIFYTRYEKEN